MTLSERLRGINWILLGLAVLLTAAGVAAIAVATPDDGPSYAWLQVRWAVVALAATLLVLSAPYDRLVAASPVAYVLGLASLLLVLAVGSGKGAERWIDVAAFRVQPSEFMKLILVVTLAAYVRYRQGYKRFSGLAWPFALTLVPVALVMRQPDLGTALLLVPILFVSLFVAGAKPSHLGLVALAGVLAGLVLYFVPGLLEPYQKDRVKHFLLQGSDTEAAALLRRKQGFQLEASKTAVAAGGVFGAPGAEALDDAIGRLPERRTDFVFSAFAARWGLAGVTALFVGYLAFLALLLAAASRVREPSGRIVCVGVFTLFAVQALVNLSMTLGLLPVVGVTLPFFSYGGSSLLTSFLAVGLVLSVESDRKVEFGVGDFD